LASAFALLPEGDWKIPQMANLATRLVECLPRPGASPIANIAKGRPAGKATSQLTSWPTRWLFWLAIAIGWFLLLSYFTTNPVYDSTPTVSTSK
jgi:hypothetical protein